MRGRLPLCRVASVVTIGVFFVLAVLATAAQAHDVTTGPIVTFARSQQAGPYSITVLGSPYTGENVVSVAVESAGEQAPFGTVVRLVAEPPPQGQGAPVETDSLVPDGDGHFTLRVPATAPGTWRLTITVDGPEGTGTTALQMALAGPPLEVPTTGLFLGVVLVGLTTMAIRNRRRAAAERV